jgi:hypothetical protein
LWGLDEKYRHCLKQNGNCNSAGTIKRKNKNYYLDDTINGSKEQEDRGNSVKNLFVSEKLPIVQTFIKRIQVCCLNLKM